MGNKGFSIPYIVVFVAILVIIGLYLKNTNQTTQHEKITITPQTNEEKAESQDKIVVEDFLKNDLSKFPKFKSQVSVENIKRVFIFPLEELDENRLPYLARIVEIENNSGTVANPNFKTYSYYLLTPTLEKELVNVMSTVSEDKEVQCNLEKVQTVGNEHSLGRELHEKGGYIILSGGECAGFGAANGGFVSVYSLDTGEKIKLTGDFSIPHTIWKGVSSSGNALGILKGIYGVNQPTLIIEYGNFGSAATPLEQVSVVAYFDLQSGKLKQLVKFD